MSVTKVCSGLTCGGVARPAEDFYKNRARADGLSSQCKRCQREYTSRPAVRKAANASTAAWQKRNPDKRAATNKRWRDGDPLNQRLLNGAREARHHGGLADRLSPEILRAYWESHGIGEGVCYYTGEPLGDDWHLDHMTPLSRGGHHGADNLVPCTPFVNMSKGRQTAEEYLGG